MVAAAASSFWSGIFGGCSERPGEDDWTCAFAAGTKSFTRNADLLRSLVASQGDHPCQAEHDPDGLRAARWRAELPYKQEPRSGCGRGLETGELVAWTTIEPHPLTILAGNDAEAVMLNLMQPQAAGRQRVGFGWEARRDEAGWKSTRTGKHDARIHRQRWPRLEGRPRWRNRQP